MSNLNLSFSLLFTGFSLTVCAQVEFPDFSMDGMRCDIKGNLYITRFGKGMVVIASPEGKVIREISLVGKRPTNIAIGGKTDVQFMLLSRIRGTLRVSV